MKEKKQKRVFKPEKQTLRLSERLLPELKTLDVGKEYTITLKVKMTSKSEGDQYGECYFDCDEHEDAEYEKARQADRAQMKGTFDVLTADEESDNQKSPEQLAADKIMAGKKQKKII